MRGLNKLPMIPALPTRGVSRIWLPLLCIALVASMASAGELGNLKQIDAERIATLLDENTRIENFRHTDRTFPIRVIHRGSKPFQFREAPRELNKSYQFGGKTKDVAEFFKSTITTGLLVVKDDAIVYEHYDLGNDRDSLATSMSVAKSFISALVGICVDEGLIQSIDEPITKYVPELKGSGYDGVKIKHVLQMSSGIDFTEEYGEMESDINLLIGELAAGRSIKDYAASRKSKRPSGKTFYYASIDTEVLGMLVEKVTGKSVSQNMQERLWQPLGMESDAFWCLDNHGNEIAFALLNATLRDYAKFGRLFLNKGNWNGMQVVSEKWVADSTKPDQEYLKLKDYFAPGWDIGYQYQWWVPPGDEGEFTGIGIWGQYLYVNPQHRTIIVKSSVDPNFDGRDMESVAFFRSIVKHYAAE